MSKTAFEELLESLEYFRSRSQASKRPPERPVERVGTPAEREAAKLIVDFLKSRGYVFYRRPPVERRIEPPPVEDKFYSRQGRNLFIYVRERGDLIDLDLFPEELNLFGPESAWRLNNKAVIVSDVEEGSLDRAEAILEENGFRRWDHDEEVLVHYFTRGDFSLFEEPTIGAQAYGS
ncbi:hypothetical protein E3J39_04965 [Candidatus Bathyarchaeota archaeon]|nr:MAG: hypothetical protein E3J39_04965 [Candidatus Bathyarchaeota archaeon]